MIFTLKVIVGIAAVLVGGWFGLPGRYAQTPDEIEEVMANGTGRRKQRKKRLSPFAWLQREKSVSTNRGSRGFGVRSPDDR